MTLMNTQFIIKHKQNEVGTDSGTRGGKWICPLLLQLATSSPDNRTLRLITSEFGRRSCKDNGVQQQTFTSRFLLME